METQKWEYVEKTPENKISVPTSGNKITINVSSPTKLIDSTISGTIISAYSKDNKLVFSAGFPLTWNTYSASSALGEIHMFVRTPNMDSEFIALPRTIESLRSAYVIKSDEKLFLFDAPDGDYYPLKDSKIGKYIFDNNPVKISPEPFKNIGYQYSYGAEKNGDWVVKACKLSKPNDCNKIATTPKSIVFAYGGNELNTVAVTNRGDVLFHNRQGWCRGKKTSDGGVKCDKQAKDFDALYKTQLYSSIRAKDGTLLGEYPTGRFWKLGDGIITPTPLSPYDDTEHKNRELQSVSMFCGDLYAGFWPQGEVWEKPLESNGWIKTKRLFSHPVVKDGDVPYLSNLESGNNGKYPAYSFFGQRATSMVNYKNSLFISSSNLGGWSKDIPKPSFMTDSQANEYGRIYSKTDSNCLTTVIDSNVNLVITIDSNSMSVTNNGKEIAKTNLHDFDIKQIDYFTIGDGIFGKISDENIDVNFLNNN
ncbi:MAG: hypothetical protein R3D71_10235 [Rickettsiales bacterium]